MVFFAGSLGVCQAKAVVFDGKSSAQTFRLLVMVPVLLFARTITGKF